jgi:predicted O-linked N-acetylglucosamine transferase (SPINDLY family)
VGLPVLTFIGETFASRVAASLLNALDLPELVMSSEKEYEETAIKFMNDLDYLSEIKEKIKKNKSKKPLFDTNLFTKNLEMSYIKMCERYENDKELDHIEIDN